MRIVSVRTENVGGLVDGYTELPNSSVIALAGSNGSGKSRFLRCLAAPWVYQGPEPADPERAAVTEVTIEFDAAEQAAQANYAIQTGIIAAIGIPLVTIKNVRSPLGGNRTETVPASHAWVANMLKQEQIARFVPSLSLVYVPAERRLNSYNNPFTIVSLSPEDNARSVAAMRESQGGFGLLDDYEFEDYARTLCVAAYLPNEHGAIDGAARQAWDRFKSGIDEILAPKRLLPLTQEYPSSLRIQLPSGQTHGIEGLSSGERQALILVSRIFRAGEGHSSVLVDEPDAYLHPSLSSKLMRALKLGLPSDSRLIVATHSPSILDDVEPTAILRFEQAQSPSTVRTDDERLQLYRQAGFRASALTQSDFLVVTEGDLDRAVLGDLIPEMSRGASRSAGGRDLVLRDVAALKRFELPIIGVVDADVLAARPSPAISNNVHVWSKADIEGVLLSSSEFLAAAIETRLIDPSITDPSYLREYFRNLALARQEETIREFVVRWLRARASAEWPSPQHEDIESALKSVGRSLSAAVSQESIASAFEEAHRKWEENATEPLALVRGKHLLSSARSAGVVMTTTSESFIRAALVSRPRIPEIESVNAMLSSLTS